MRTALAVAALTGALAALAALDFKAGDDPWASLLILGVCAGFGFAIGRWRAVALALLVVPAAAVRADPDRGVSGSVWLAATVGLPVIAAALALGVVARRVASGQRS